MNFTAGIFEHDDAFNEQARTAARQAAAVAHKRAKDRFGSFLDQASTDFHQRFALVEDELAQVVADVVAEYGGDEDRVLASVTSVLAAGGFCDDCRKWKSGPKAGCECKGKEPSEALADDGPDGEESEGTTSRVASWTVMTNFSHGDRVRINYPRSWAHGMTGSIEGGEGSLDLLAPQSEAFGPWKHHVLLDDGTGRVPIPAENLVPEAPDGSMTAAVRHAEALETVELPTGDDTALGGPSPKIDKTTWKPNALNEKGNLSPIDTEGAGSPHPTVTQDVYDVADHSKDPLDETDNLTESQDVGKEKGIDHIHTDTWNGTADQADPVTSAAQDVERNPLRTMMEQGFIPQSAIDSALSDFESKS